MKFSKIQMIIKYNINNSSDSIYAHIFEHIFVKITESDDWFNKYGAMVFGSTNFDYVGIEIEMLKATKKNIYKRLFFLLETLKNSRELFENEKEILKREIFFIKKVTKRK